VSASTPLFVSVYMASYQKFCFTRTQPMSLVSNLQNTAVCRSQWGQVNKLTSPVWAYPKAATAGARSAQASSHTKSLRGSHSTDHRRNLRSTPRNSRRRSKLHSHRTSPRQACHTAYRCHYHWRHIQSGSSLFHLRASQLATMATRGGFLMTFPLE